MVSRSHPGFVLSSAYYGGTLAATRCLGQRGVAVFIADSARLAPASWSRYVVQRLRSPPGRPIEPFLDWLAAFGRREPGHVLYATSDDLAWAFAEHESTLKRDFRLFTPPFSTIARLLDKRALYEACSEAAIETPWTRFPRGAGELDALARDVPFPVIVKPRTQVLFSLRKGLIARSKVDLREGYAGFVRAERYQPELVVRRPDIEHPMVQEYCGAEPMYSISGFCDPRHDLFVARAAHKIAQWPREAGLGIGFEDAAVDENLARRVRHLCQTTGFFGVFEAEFVARAGRRLLVDFNPRFFGQMGFDTARGQPSAYFVYLAAIGDLTRLREEVGAARAWHAPGRMLYLDKTALVISRIAERLVGRSRPGISMRNGTGEPATVHEFTIDRYDWLPGITDASLQIERSLRHAATVLRTAARGS